MLLDHTEQVLMGPRFITLVVMILELQDADGTFPRDSRYRLGSSRALWMSSSNLEAEPEERTFQVVQSDHRSR